MRSGTFALRLMFDRFPILRNGDDRPAKNANQHAALDRAVWAAYGWDDDTCATSDEENLARLLTVNGERAGGSWLLQEGGRMSLTGHLKEPRSPIRQFIFE